MEKYEDAQFKKMTEAPISRLVISLGIPTTISMLVTNIYNMADTYFVGRLGTSAWGCSDSSNEYCIKDKLFHVFCWARYWSRVSADLRV